MTNQMKYPVLLALLILVAVPAAAAAKGAVDLITIEGPGLNEPIRLTDHSTLEQFNPWAGQFLGPAGRLKLAPAVGDPYPVKFYLNGLSGQPELHYVFYYYFNPEPGRGYIYLPGPEDESFDINQGTIIRNSDGRWLHASAGWDQVMARVVGALSPEAGRGQLVRLGAVLLAAAALLAALIAGRLRRIPAPEVSPAA